MNEGLHMATKKKKFSLIQRILNRYPHPNNVEQYRLKMNISQNELAANVEKLAAKKFGTPYNLSQQTINAIETYRYAPSYGLMMLISEVLSQELETIFDSNAKTD
jgi:DNA-binding XRE family transcriptional regulator